MICAFASSDSSLTTRNARCSASNFDSTPSLTRRAVAAALFFAPSKRCASLAASSGTASSPESSGGLCGSQGLTSNGGSMSNDSSSEFGVSWASNELSDRLTIAKYATTHFLRRQSRIGKPRALTLRPDLSPVTRVLLERGPRSQSSQQDADVANRGRRLRPARHQLFRLRPRTIAVSGVSAGVGTNGSLMVIREQK